MIIPQNKVDNASKKADMSALLYQVGQAQDRQAFTQLFDYYAPRVKSFLMRGGMDDTKAEELMQDTFISVWHRAKNYDPNQSQASTWIFTVARNKKIDLIRKEKRYEIDPNDPLFVETNVSKTKSAIDVVDEQKETEILKGAIAALPEEQAKLVELSFYENLTHQEISDQYDIPLGTVKSRLRLALEKLKRVNLIKDLNKNKDMA